MKERLRDYLDIVFAIVLIVVLWVFRVDLNNFEGGDETDWSIYE